jgi:hypothetical protein
MAAKEVTIPITLEAKADLSALQFTFVDVDASSVDVNGRARVGAPTGAGGMAIGVLQNKPAALGRPAEVDIYGLTKVKAGAACAAGIDIQTDANGAAIAAATSDISLGHSVTAASAADELMEVLLKVSEAVIHA